jgi:hypothetical protein
MKINTHIGFGEFVDVVEEAAGGVVDEDFGHALVGHAAEDFLLRPQTDVARLESLRGHHCDTHRKRPVNSINPLAPQKHSRYIISLSLEHL